MQTIITKFISATDTRGSRIKASFASGGANDNRPSVTIPYPHEDSGAACHWQAAKILVERMGWHGREFTSGALNDGYVFVFSSDEKFILCK